MAIPLVSQAFQRMPLKGKFLLVVLMTSGLSVLFACSVLVANDLLENRQSLVKELSSQASLVGENSSAALVFQDQEGAQEIFAAEQIRRMINRALSSS